jgi:hypothetical protein
MTPMTEVQERAEQPDLRYIERWWHHNPEERFWLEATDREDEIGLTIEGRFFDEADRRRPAYLLAKHEVTVGDVVVHVDLSQRAFVACSTVAEAIVEDYDAEYWTIHLSDKRRVRPQLPFSEFERREAEIAAIVGALPLTRPQDNSRYLPFTWRTKEGFVLNQGAYITKLPAAVVGLFPALAQAADGRRR